MPIEFTLAHVETDSEPKPMVVVASTRRGLDVRSEGGGDLGVNMDKAQHLVRIQVAWNLCSALRFIALRSRQRAQAFAAWRSIVPVGTGGDLGHVFQAALTGRHTR
jgi:hypothetical protein